VPSFLGKDYEKGKDILNKKILDKKLYKCEFDYNEDEDEDYVFFKK
jgi:hypothetical protein